MVSEIPEHFMLLAHNSIRYVYWNLLETVFLSSEAAQI